MTTDTEIQPKVPDSEHAVVASLIFQPEMWFAASGLTPEMFSRADARQAFGKLQDAKEAGRPWMLDDFGGYWYQHEPYCVHLSQQLAEHVRRVREAYVCRKGLDAAKDIAKAAGRLDYQGVSNAVAEIRLPAASTPGARLDQIAADLFDEIGEGDSNVVSTGFGPLDRAGFLRRTELTVLGARPSVGKSQLAFQAGLNNARDGRKALIWSGEMSRHRVVDRMVQAMCGVSPRYSKTMGDSKSVSDALSQLTTATTLTVLDEPITSHDLRSIADQTANDMAGLDLVIVDHIRLLKDTHNAERHRLGNITHNLKVLAQETGCAVLAIAQLNRSVAHTESKRPTLTDLRDSGEIEENTDQVWFLHRDAYWERMQGERTDQSGEAIVYAAKNRNGPLNRVKLWFEAKDFVRFAEVDWSKADE